jgi:hypothetical protein
MERVVDGRNVKAALKRVRQNKGSPGVDGMTVDELPKYLAENWVRIREQLLEGSYQPKPVREVEIVPTRAVLVDSSRVEVVERSQTQAGRPATEGGPGVLAGCCGQNGRRRHSRSARRASRSRASR